MINALGLLKTRRFLPLFGTQFLGAFNDNLYKQATVLFATYSIFNDPKVEQGFSALAFALSTLPFILLSALSGQLADAHDKARIIRIVKTAEIGIMALGAAGLLLAKGGHSGIGLALALAAIFLLGVHSTFFGPIKYAILPQHLPTQDVLGATGLVEAATYLSILLGTILAGYISIEIAALVSLAIAGIGWMTARRVPDAPRLGPRLTINPNPFTSSWRLITATLHIPRLYLAIAAISYFWTIGSVLIIIFPPLVKNVLTTTQSVASLFTATMSIGIAIGSVVINTLLKGRILAKYAPGSAVAMGLSIVAFALVVRSWAPLPPGHYYALAGFLAQPRAALVVLCLLAVAVTGGMFVVPLYAFLTTTVAKDQTARTVAANNVVNSCAMVVGAISVYVLSDIGVSSVGLLFIAAASCLLAAWLALQLHRACD